MRRPLSGALRPRSNLLFSSILYNMIGRALTLIAPLVIFPHMLEQLGDRGFAIWITGVSLTSLAAFLDFGIGNSLLTRLSTSFGHSDTVSARMSIAASFRIMSIVSLCLLLLLAIFGLSIQLVGSAAPFQIDADSILAGLVFLFFVLNLPVMLVQRILLAHQQVFLLNLMLVLQAFVSVILALVGIGLDQKNWIIVSLYSGSPVVFWFVVNVWYFWSFPQYRPSISDCRSGVDRSGVLKLGLPHFLLGVLGAVGMNLDIPIVLSTLGAESVSEFALPARIGLIFYMIVATAYIPLWAFFGSAISKGECDWVRRVSTYLSIFGALVILAFGLLTWLMIDRIMLAWAARSFDDQGLVVLGFVCMAVVIAFTSPWNMVLNASGVIGIQIFAWSGFVLTSIAAKVVLAPNFGFWTIGLISAVSYLLLITGPIVFVAIRMLRNV